MRALGQQLEPPAGQALCQAPGAERAAWVPFPASGFSAISAAFAADAAALTAGQLTTPTTRAWWWIAAAGVGVLGLVAVRRRRATSSAPAPGGF